MNEMYRNTAECVEENKTKAKSGEELSVQHRKEKVEQDTWKFNRFGRK